MVLKLGVIPVRSSCSPSNISEPLLVACFNAHSVGAAERRTEIANFVVNRNVDILFITESWLRESGDEAKLCDLSPAGYSIRSFPRLSRGGGIAVLAKKNTFNCLTFSTILDFDHSSFELVQATLTLQKRSVQFFCLYRPPPSKKNKLSHSMFL